MGEIDTLHSLWEFAARRNGKEVTGLGIFEAFMERREPSSRIPKTVKFACV